MRPGAAVWAGAASLLGWAARYNDPRKGQARGTGGFPAKKGDRGGKVAELGPGAGVGGKEPAAHGRDDAAPPLARVSRPGTHRARLERVVELGAARPRDPVLPGPAGGEARAALPAQAPPGRRRRHGGLRPRARRRRDGPRVSLVAPSREDRDR